MITDIKTTFNNVRVNAVNALINDDVIKESTLLTELKKYYNVFFTKATNKLLLNAKHDHFIKITVKSFYDSLYNLFNTKLTTLRNYLNDSLTKR